ncbi:MULTISPECIES: hypothetical protein [Luteimonas]|nr:MULTISPECIES: hypothetical protein [Luteimonas]
MNNQNPRQSSQSDTRNTPGQQDGRDEARRQAAQRQSGRDTEEE